MDDRILCNAGSTVTLVTVGASPGEVQITCTGTDEAGQTATHNIVVTITSPSPSQNPQPANYALSHSTEIMLGPRASTMRPKLVWTKIALSLQQHSDARLDTAKIPGVCSLQQQDVDRNGPMSKRILVVSDDAALRRTRMALLQSAGYVVDAVCSDNEAMASVWTKSPDLVLMGGNSDPSSIAFDRRLREAFPDLLILKIQPLWDEGIVHSSRVTTATPREVLAAVADMFRTRSSPHCGHDPLIGPI